MSRVVLLIFGVILTAALTSAGMLVVYNAQQDRQRSVVVCEQVSELREDILMFEEARGAAARDLDAFRTVRCPT